MATSDRVTWKEHTHMSSGSNDDGFRVVDRELAEELEQLYQERLGRVTNLQDSKT
jgi:hypothetical protein